MQGIASTWKASSLALSDGTERSQSWSLLQPIGCLQCPSQPGKRRNRAPRNLSAKWPQAPTLGSVWRGPSLLWIMPVLSGPEEPHGNHLALCSLAQTAPPPNSQGTKTVAQKSACPHKLRATLGSTCSLHHTLFFPPSFKISVSSAARSWPMDSSGRLHLQRLIQMGELMQDGGQTLLLGTCAQSRWSAKGQNLRVHQGLGLQHCGSPREPQTSMESLTPTGSLNPLWQASVLHGPP